MPVPKPNRRTSMNPIVKPVYTLKEWRELNALFGNLTRSHITQLQNLYRNAKLNLKIWCKEINYYKDCSVLDISDSTYNYGREPVPNSKPFFTCTNPRFIIEGQVVQPTIYPDPTILLFGVHHPVWWMNRTKNNNIKNILLISQ